MNFKDIDLEISPDHPFQGDRLGRQTPIRALADIVRVLGVNGCVLAINGEWGTGKTTFIKMWENFILSNEIKGNPLYFNAWERDYQEDPLVALLGEFHALFPHDEKLKKVLGFGSKLFIRTGKAVATTVSAATGNPLIASGVEMTADSLESAIDKYQSSKKDFSDFKNALIDFVASNSEEYPVVFFIDELDRCNPHYAVKVLERIKHLFDIPNIVFVLALNSDQLQHSVRGYYGSNLIDGKEYLNRFIDMYYTLPSPNIREYAKFLYDYHDFGSFFNRGNRLYTQEALNNEEMLKNFFPDLLEANHFNLRTLNKFVAFVRFCFMAFSDNNNTSADFIYFMCFLKYVHPDVLETIYQGRLYMQGLYTLLEETIPSEFLSGEKDGFSPHHFSFAIAELMWRYYYSDYSHQNREKFEGVPRDNQRYFDFPIETKTLDKEQLNIALHCTIQGRRSDTVYNGLKYIFERLNLLYGLQNN